MRMAFTTSNLLRKEKYKLLTTIYENRGKLFVRKSVLSTSGQPHLRQLSQAESLIEKELKFLKTAKTLRKKKNYIDYEYVHLPSLTQLIEKNLIERKFEEALEQVQKGLIVLDNLPKLEINPYDSKEFIKIFDPKKVNDERVEACAKFGFLDLKHDNLLLNSKELYIIDYEWVYPFPLPLKYLKYRALLYLANSLQLIIDTLCSKDFPCIKFPGKVLIPKSWYQLAPLNEEEINHFSFYENNFQNFINLIPHPIHPEKLDLKEITSSQIEDLDDKGYGASALKVRMLEDELKHLKKQLDSSSNELQTIKASKFFKTWRGYHNFKEKLIS